MLKSGAGILPRLARLRYSREAAADIDEIATYSMSAFGPLVAADYIDALQAACALIGEFPAMGPVARKVSPDLRIFKHQRHNIFYQKEKEGVFVVRILHVARDWPSLLR